MANTPSDSNPSQFKRKRSSIVLLGIIIAGLVLAGAITMLLQRGGPEVTPDPPNANADHSGIVVNPEATTQHSLVIYLDYQCPWCARFDIAFRDIINQAADDGVVKVEYRAMTFLDSMLGNDSSVRGAVAAACADEVGVYREVHEEILNRQPAQEGDGFTDDQLREIIPSAVGLSGGDLTAYQRCFDTQATIGFVQGTNTKAGQAGINSTPTYLLDGVQINNQIDYQNPATLQALFDTLG
ncbi:MAG: DsbA family protein [Propionibacteriaceae bacterium]|jgi:protein-disulfide isomerase|nr:DsbA family protein [Propionibacteriaceae bacterium]